MWPNTILVNDLGDHYVQHCVYVAGFNVQYSKINKDDISCFWLWGIVMKDQRKIEVKARGFQVNTQQRGTNEQWQAKNVKQEGKRLRN